MLEPDLNTLRERAQREWRRPIASTPLVEHANLPPLPREDQGNKSWLDWLIWLPSVASIAGAATVGLYYAHVITSDIITQLVLSAGILIATVFLAGLPISAMINRKSKPMVAIGTIGFWTLCILFLLVVMGCFAFYRPEFTSTPQVPALPSIEETRLDKNIRWDRMLLAEYKERLATTTGPEHQQLLRTSVVTGYAEIAARLKENEARRWGAPASAVEPSRRTTASSFYLEAVALLMMLIGAAIGLLISASSRGLTETTVPAHIEAAQPAAGTAACHSSRGPDSFELWARPCVLQLQSGRTFLEAAHEKYLQFCDRNDDPRPLTIQEFDRRLRSDYGITLMRGDRPFATNGAAV